MALSKFHRAAEDEPAPIPARELVRALTDRRHELRERHKSLIARQIGLKKAGVGEAAPVAPFEHEELVRSLVNGSASPSLKALHPGKEL